MRWTLLTVTLVAGAALAALAASAKIEIAGLAAIAQNQVAQLVRPDYSVSAEKAVKEVRIGGEKLPMRIWFATVMPGEKLLITLPSGYAMRIDGKFRSRRGAVNEWQAPENPGTTDIMILKPNGEMVNRLSVFTLEPAEDMKDGWLNGYRIGNYAADAPQGFIRIDGPEDMELPVSPHFRIGQFMCKQQPDHWPKYVLVTPSLLTRLESVMRELNGTGTTEADTLFVMSGYRTPFYNTAIRGAKRSRHMFGDAADVYVDHSPRDGVMDDLSGDERVTRADANWLYDFASKTFIAKADIPQGGIGAYGANAVHGPFVHIDGRGQRARWGR
ncbi:MAG: D-Ala-D-Ala carboxypeptidase family metallohydrolase [Minwuia sp.]|uniref:D-Ala-D-Ala carboxypeptidase family metallohydrolase n=1 Tax=Minwuia sp. TaxID=2493630 RepID=UPI003A84F2D3